MFNELLIADLESTAASMRALQASLEKLVATELGAVAAQEVTEYGWGRLQAASMVIERARGRAQVTGDPAVDEEEQFPVFAAHSDANKAYQEAFDAWVGVSVAWAFESADFVIWSLKRLRTEAGVSMDALASDLPVSQAMVSMIESGTRFPRVDIAREWAKSLGHHLVTLPPIPFEQSRLVRRLISVVLAQSRTRHLEGLADLLETHGRELTTLGVMQFHEPAAVSLLLKVAEVASAEMATGDDSSLSGEWFRVLRRLSSDGPEHLNWLAAKYDEAPALFN